MDFEYYVIRKSDMQIIEGTRDLVSAYNLAAQKGMKCVIMQGCVITEVGEDPYSPSDTQQVGTGKPNAPEHVVVPDTVISETVEPEIVEATVIGE